MRIHISPHNYRQYSAAFYDDECVECNETINEGDPIGFLEDQSTHSKESSRYGPLCCDCLDELKSHMEVSIGDSDRVSEV
jgi:hypothetical protein